MPSPLSTAKTPDRIILFCQQNKISCQPTSELPSIHFPYHYNVVRVGNIVFGVYAHTTGNSLSGWILNDAGESYQFISTTYWFSDKYCFNPATWEHGAWDDVVDAAHRLMEPAKEMKKKAA